MPTANYSVSFTAVLSAAADAVSPGMALLKTTSGYVVATAANRTAYGRRADGIALDAGAPRLGIRVQHDGLVTSDVTGLGAGTESWVLVDSSGTLARVADADIVDGDDLVGRCATDGDLHLQPNTWTADTALATPGGSAGNAKGRTNKAMASANQTLTSDEASKAVWRTTGTLGARRKLTAPAPATAADGYVVTVSNDCDDNYPVRLSVGTGAETDLPPKKSGVFEVTPTGVFMRALSSPVHVIDAHEWGVIDDGVQVGGAVTGTDNTAALQAAIDAAVSVAGLDVEQPSVEIRFRNRGIVKIAGNLSIDGKTRLTIRGPVQLHFTTAGTTAFLQILSSSFVFLRDVAISYENPSFAGNFIQTGHGVSGADCSHIHILDCRAFCTDTSFANYNAWGFVRFSNTIDSTVEGCDISMVGRGVSGRCNGTAGDPDEVGFANSITVRNNAFHRLKIAGIYNPGEGWDIGGNNFEPVIVSEGVFDSHHAIWQEDTTYFSWALNITGNWIGDGGGVGTEAWIEGRWLGANIAGNLISGDECAIRLRGAFGTHIVGNRISGYIDFSNQVDLTTPGDHLDSQYPVGVAIIGNTIQAADPYRNTGNIAGSYVRFGNEDATGENNLFDLPFTIPTSQSTFANFSLKSVTWDPGTVANGAVATSGDIAAYGLRLGDAASVGATYVVAAVATPLPDGVMLFARAVDNYTARVTLLNMSGAGFTPGDMTVKIHGAG